MTEALFGVLTGPINVEEAILATLREWLPAYLYELEEQNGLQPKDLGRPPAPESYKGGLDWESVRQDYLPAIVAVANPVGEPQRQTETYVQAFEARVGCVVLSQEGEDPEAAARKQAGLWATAVMGAIVQHGSLEHSWVQETVLVGAPRVEFFDTEQRRAAVGVTTFHVYAELMTPKLGPRTVKTVEGEGPYPNLPEVTSEIITVKAV